MSDASGKIPGAFFKTADMEEGKMYRKSEMRKKEKEELRKIAMEKNKKGIATPAARFAQELLWEDHYPCTERREDDYEGWSLWDDEYR